MTRAGGPLAVGSPAIEFGNNKMLRTYTTQYFAFCLAVITTLGCDGRPIVARAATEDDATRCADGVDNDGDGAVDCDDDECVPHCADQFVPPQEDTWHNRERSAEPIEAGPYVVERPEDGSFPLVTGEFAAPLMVSPEDFEGVIRAVGDLRGDVGRVTGNSPDIINDNAPAPGNVAVVIGTLGRSPLIDSLVDAKKLDVAGLEGKWETFVITAIDTPTEGLDRALVVAGSDQRGTIYGIYDLAAQIGVSPWHFWADVPPQKKSELHVVSGRHTRGEPAVKYRGIFINDEDPALDQWHRHYFPNEGRAFKHELYSKIFEVMLRLKANYLWPAVWGRAFAEDDPENHATAKRYGIVMGTSHEAPMMRGIEEWNRDAQEGTSDPYGGNGEWSYRTNADALEAYWEEGIERMVDEDFEGIVTVGMRGPGDVALPPDDGIPLVNDFVDAQRSIIERVTGAHPARLPQVWTLYKEVQDWWDRGLRVPSDVTVIWCDDNWGNLQHLPDPEEPERSGGYGLYYHFDYVGGPRSYKWVDTNLVPNIWEQLHLAYQRGVDRVWMVNVGDLKGNELPTQFFMDYAWSPESWPAERLAAWEQQYAAQQFGSEHAEAIAAVMHTYASLQSDRKPELLNVRGYSDEGSPFSLTNYAEMERVVEQWQELAVEAARIDDLLPSAAKDAYYELVRYPIDASALMYDLRRAGFNNLLYAEQGRAAANDMATLAEERFAQSQELRDYYGSALADGKWAGFQSQSYLGYDDWQQPSTSRDFIHPKLVTVEVPSGVAMGVAISGSADWWPPVAEGSDTTDGADTSDEPPPPVLPTFSPYQTASAQYVEVFRRGTDALDYEIWTTPEVTWLTVSGSEGTLDDALPQARAELSVSDWAAVPDGITTMTVTVANITDGSTVEVQARFDKPEASPAEGSFVESNGYVSIEAAHENARIVDSSEISWQLIPDIGRTGSGLTPFPVTAERQTPGNDDCPRLEYALHLFTSGAVTVQAYLSPRQNTYGTDGLEIALSIDEGEPEVINITRQLNVASFPLYKQGWQLGVANNVHRVSAQFEIEEPGAHVLKVWMVDPSVIVQKLVLDTGGLLDSYLGPPPSYVMPSSQ